MAESVPTWPNFFATLDTSLSRRQVSGLFRRAGWHVRPCSWTDFEVSCPFAEMIIESERPILLRGAVIDVTANAGRVLAPLGHPNVDFEAEAYGPDDELIGEYFSNSRDSP